MIYFFAISGFIKGEQTGGCNYDCKTDMITALFFKIMRLVPIPVFFILFIVLLARTRYRIRSRYAIPDP
jgi:hypothetical protein